MGGFSRHLRNENSQYITCSIAGIGFDRSHHGGGLFQVQLRKLLPQTKSGPKDGGFCRDLAGCFFMRMEKNPFPKIILPGIFPWRLITGPYHHGNLKISAWKIPKVHESPFGTPIYFQVPFFGGGGGNRLVREIKDPLSGWWLNQSVWKMFFSVVKLDHETPKWSGRK